MPFPPLCRCTPTPIRRPIKTAAAAAKEGGCRAPSRCWRRACASWGRLRTKNMRLRILCTFNRGKQVIAARATAEEQKQPRSLQIVRGGPKLGCTTVRASSKKATNKPRQQGRTRASIGLHRDPEKPLRLMVSKAPMPSTETSVLPGASSRAAVSRRATLRVDKANCKGEHAAASSRVPGPEPRRRPFAPPFEVLMSTFADSLTSLPSPGLSNLDGPCPDLSDLLAACPSSPGASRLPARLSCAREDAALRKDSVQVRKLASEKTACRTLVPGAPLSATETLRKKARQKKKMEGIGFLLGKTSCYHRNASDSSVRLLEGNGAPWAKRSPCIPRQVRSCDKLQDAGKQVFFFWQVFTRATRAFFFEKGVHMAR